MSKLRKFLEELDELSRKHEIWIQVNDTNYVDLIDGEYNVIAKGLYNDENTQEYLVEENYRDCIE